MDYKKYHAILYNNNYHLFAWEKIMINLRKIIMISIICMRIISPAYALEYPIGKPQMQYGMEISAIYLQPIKMEPNLIMRKSEESDIHLETDIRAIAKNPNGFAEGDWIPYLIIKFNLNKIGSNKLISGDMMPMVANDGPHYGDNVKLDGPGKYKLKIKIFPPIANQCTHFGRHIDKETGVNPWFKPFELQFEFIFSGVGKKGGY